MGDRDLEGLGGKDKLASADVKELAGIPHEKIQRLEAVEYKKTEAGTENDREGVFAEEKPA